ncbi:MAG: hypothetical protein EBZ48_17080, partial [Proteobacteria bacterium]|nr:hypothetical protein [Pseudomonadota bacterium]
ERFNSIRDVVESFPDSEQRGRAEQILRELLRSKKGLGAFVLPSIAVVKSVPSVMNALVRTERRSKLPKGADDIVRKSYEMISLLHAHNILVKTARVNFLEYVGRKIFRCRAYAHSGGGERNKGGDAPVRKIKARAGQRIVKPKPQELALFPPGRLPLWWREMAKGTPYELIGAVNSVMTPTDPLQRFLSTHGKEAASRIEIEGAFFSTGSALGVAAQQLVRSRFEEHPKVSATLAWLKGSVRRNAPGQVLVYCGYAIEARYLAHLLQAHTGEETVTLVGSKYSKGV